MGDLLMPAGVQFSAIVREALEKVAHSFANEPERKHFAEYITGLIIVNRKNVSCGNRKYI